MNNLPQENETSLAQAAADQGAGELAAVAREQTEYQTMVLAAKRFPRDEQAAYARIVKACKRPSLAEVAVYSYPRGGRSIKGPSVNLARELARYWGNVHTGTRLVSVSDSQVHVKGFATDLETNTTIESEDKFDRLIQRRQKDGKTKWVKPDERDKRELQNKHGAICMRNSLLQLLPSDLIEEAVRMCQDTLRKAARGELEQSREDAIRRLVLAFDQVGVTTEMLTEWLGHDLELVNELELADLREIWKSINDGNSRREDYFTVPNRAAEKAQSLETALTTKQGAKKDAAKKTRTKNNNAAVPKGSKAGDAGKNKGSAQQEILGDSRSVPETG